MATHAQLTSSTSWDLYYNKHSEQQQLRDLSHWSHNSKLITDCVCWRCPLDGVGRRFRQKQEWTRSIRTYSATLSSIKLHLCWPHSLFYLSIVGTKGDKRCTYVKWREKQGLPRHTFLSFYAGNPVFNYRKQNFWFRRKINVKKAWRKVEVSQHGLFKFTLLCL